MTIFKAKVSDYIPNTKLQTKSQKWMEFYVLQLEDETGKTHKFQGFPSQLKTDRKLSQQLGAIQSGDWVNVEVELNGAGYNSLVGITPAYSGSSDPISAQATPVGSRSMGGTTKDFETKEERAVRQKLIVRQSSLSNSLEFYNNKKVSIKEVLATATVFYNWVFDDQVDGSDIMSNIPFDVDIPQ